MIFPQRRIQAVLMCLVLCFPLSGWADCIKKPFLIFGHHYVRMSFGTINLQHPSLQPVGSLLATSTAAPANDITPYLTGETVVWVCDIKHEGKLHFLVATNGADAMGGYWPVHWSSSGTVPDGVFLTAFKQVGLKLTVGGHIIRRHWLRVPLETYTYIDKNGKHGKEKQSIAIRVRDLPVLQAELYRVSDKPITPGPPENGCGFQREATPAGTVYSCTVPSAYVQLAGSHIDLKHDEQGKDSKTHRDFLSDQNGVAYRIDPNTMLAKTATCVARHVTPVVLFPPMTVSQLMAGSTVTKDFSIQVECSKQAVSGVGKGQTALGLQASPGAFQAAQQTLGLINAAGGVSHLVDDDYANPSAAKGVGVALHHASTQTPMVFVGQPGLAGNVPADSGWYPVLYGAAALGSDAPGYTTYNVPLKATLQRLPNKSVSAGRFRAHATVLVKVQ